MLNLTRTGHGEHVDTLTPLPSTDRIDLRTKKRSSSPTGDGICDRTQFKTKRYRSRPYVRERKSRNRVTLGLQFGVTGRAESVTRIALRFSVSHPFRREWIGSKPRADATGPSPGQDEVRYKSGKFKESMVEAAGLEPASTENPNRRTTCLVHLLGLAAVLR